MKHVDLTSGIGGFALAARWAGWETVGFCEIDPWCRQVLAQNFPGVPQHDDLKTLTAEDIRRWTSDQYVITAGYPCQPFSHAGKRGGTDDPRHLWPWIRELLAALGEDKPRWCVFENVAGHVSLGLDRVLADLEDEGYACWASVVPAAGVGALHRRDRVWIVAYRDGGDETERGQREDVSPEGDGGRTERGRGRGDPGQVGLGGAGEAAGDVADASIRESDRRKRGSVAGAEGSGGRGDTSVGAGREDGTDSSEQGFPDRGSISLGEQTEDAQPQRFRFSDHRPATPAAKRGFRGAADGLPAGMDSPLDVFGCGWEYGVPLTVSGKTPDRVNRLKALGNAIVPQVAWVIFEAINAAEGADDPQP